MSAVATGLSRGDTAMEETQAKKEALEACGVRVGHTPTETADIAKQLIAEMGLVAPEI